MNQEPVIELRNVGVCYARRSGFMRQSKFWALHDVSFDLRHGETLGIIGHNGAGKSTLLRLLAGILSPDHGEIVTRAERVSLQSLQVGFVPYLSGRDNAILSGIMLGLRRRAVLEKMNEICDFAELGDFFDEPVRSYSSGMRARLGFAVAFQADPDVILIDEVLGVGDAAFREKSAAAMRTKIASDKTVVVVTHSVDTVEELCDRVIWIDHGITRAMGGTREVLAEFQKALPRRAAG